MKVEIKDKALIKNMKIMKDLMLKEMCKAMTDTQIVESALALYFFSIQQRAEKMKKMDKSRN